MENDNFKEERLKICDVCPLCNKDRGKLWICNPYLWINIETNEVSKKYKQGFKNGCGCNINTRISAKFKTCPVGKW